MKSGGLRVAVQAAVLAVLIPAAGYAGELRDKIELCTTCHGDHAQGVQAYFTAPRLAGQQVEYLENQFKAISAHRRDNPAAKTFMVPVMASVPEHMRHSLAKHFSELNASPATVPGDWSKRAGRFSRMAFPMRTCRPALPATGRTRMAATRFRVWRVSIIPTPWLSL